MRPRCSCFWQAANASPWPNPSGMRLLAFPRTMNGYESAGSSGLEEFLAAVLLLYEGEVYGGEVLVVAGPSDLDSQVSEYLLDTASEAELLEQMQLLAEGEHLYALTGSEAR